MLNRTNWSRRRRKGRPFPSEWAEILERDVAYYRCLPPAEQAELRGMLQVLLGEMAFEPGVGLESVEPPMRVVIAAQAALLLLHRPFDEWPELRTAIVYPGVYRARERVHTDEGAEVETLEERHGEAWSHGVLLFSWEDVAYDATRVDDGQNVVLHEVAHALDDRTGESDGVPLLPDAATEARWRAAFGAAYEDFVRAVKRRRRTLLDPYAAEDPAEFFAVATEAFFETPQEFVEAYPELYRLLRDFYHLDPAPWAACLAEASAG